jgi:phosphotransferase system HPr (HPr) family protein
MRSLTVQIHHHEGVHTRPAAIFVQEAAKYKSEITLTNADTSVNGKSIMGILMLALSPGTEVTLTASGIDEDLAIEKLSSLLSKGFQ